MGLSRFPSCDDNDSSILHMWTWDLLNRHSQTSDWMAIQRSQLRGDLDRWRPQLSPYAVSGASEAVPELRG